MFNKIINRSRILSISGNEDALLRQIQVETASFGTKFEYVNDCLVLMKFSHHHSNRRILVSVGADMPGFIVLGMDSKNAYLAKTSDFSLDDTKITRVIDENGKKYLLRKTKDDPPFYFVSKNKLKLGDSLGLPYQFVKEGNQLCGFGLCHFLLLELVIALSQHGYSNDIIFAFTANSLTSACRENQLIRKYRPSHVLLLGAMETGGTDPIVLYRDGKATLNGDQTIRFTRNLKACNLDFQIKLSQKPITKAERIFLENDLPVTSLLVPTSKMQTENECVSLDAIEKYEKAISNFLNFSD